MKAVSNCQSEEKGGCHVPRRERLAIFGFALFVAVGLLPQSGAAVSFLQVSYSVTGGTFNGPNLSGPITGGAISYITNPGVTSLPPGYRCSGTGTCGVLTKVQLTGPAGTFALIGSGPLYLLAASAHSGATIAFAHARVIDGFRSGGSTPTGAWHAFIHPVVSGYYPYFHHFPIFPYPDAIHIVGVGPEVRTVVPEPATAALLGLGLLGLAIGGGSAAGARRLRRR